MAETILITGPARSGKSEWAETLAIQSGLPVAYIATACRNPADPDWEARLAAHAARRDPAWVTQEVLVELPAAIARTREPCVLVDSLGTWVANCLDWGDERWQATIAALVESLVARSAGLTLLVAEETGWGVIPAYPAGRQFRDRLGDLTRQVAVRADRTYLVAGGHALDLSKLGVPLPPKLEKL